MQPSTTGLHRVQEAELAARRGDREAAYNLVRQALIDDPTYVPAWLRMSQLVDDHTRQRECLERALALDPQNKTARDRLEILRLKQLLGSIQAPILRERAPEPQPIGACLVERQLITREQLEDALWEQRARRKRGEFTQLGDLLLQSGFVTPHALANALVAQQQEKLKRYNSPTPRFLGEYLMQAGLITPLQLEAALEEQIQLRLAGKQVALGNLLIRRQYLSYQHLQAILDRQRAEFFSSMSD
jgi:hypothetical protein